MPLVDAAVLIVAHELGFARAEGVALELLRDSSWANIRDKLSVQHLDGAHCLTPLVLAHHSLQPMLPARLTVPFMLNRGGGAIVISQTLHADMQRRHAGSDPDTMRATAQALAIHVRHRQQQSERPLTFAMVSPFASHHYALRHWLLAGGVSPDRDVDLIALPPQLMGQALQQGQIDGFCAGAPWPTRAVQDIGAHIMCEVNQTLSPVPEKAFALQTDIAQADPDCLAGLIQALEQAAVWCADPVHHDDLALLLAQAAYLDMPPTKISAGLAGVRFHGHAINRPDPAIARWYAAHMLAAGQLKPGFSLAQLRQPFDPAGYDTAFGRPSVNLFDDPLFDGSRFNPDDPDAFVAHLRAANHR
jgi:two-component system, oxyanion-binding sensor